MFKNFAVINFLSLLFGIFIIFLYLVSYYSNQSINIYLTPVIVIACTAFSYMWCLPPSQITSKYFDPFYPGSLFFIFYLFYIIFSGSILWLVNDYSSRWIDLGFNYAFLVNQAFILATLGCAFFGLGLRAPININKGISIKNIFYNHKIFRYKDFKFVTIFFFVVGLIASLNILNIYYSTGDNILVFLSPRARRDAELPIGQLEVMLVYCVMWSAIFLSIISFYKKRKLPYIIIIFFTIIIVFVVTGKRSTILPILLMPLIYYHYRINWLNVSKAIRWAVIGVAIIFFGLFGRIAIPLLFNEVNLSDSIGRDFSEVAKFLLNSGEWNTFDMFIVSLKESEELNDLVGGAFKGFMTFTFATLSVLVPRAIWPEKPIFEDLGQKYFQHIENSTETVGYAVTVWGSDYQFFNIMGLTLGFFVLGWALKYIYYFIKPYNGYSGDVIIYGIIFWMVFQFLRFGTLGFTTLLFVQSMLIGFLSILFISRNILNKRT